MIVLINPIRPVLFLSVWARGGGGRWGDGERGSGGGRKVPVAHNSKTIRGIEMKFCRVIGNHKLLNLV